MQNLYPVVSEFPENPQKIEAPNDTPFANAEVDNCVSNLRSRVAPGPDGLRSIFFKKLYNYHQNFFRNIFNTALRLRHFPPQWKMSTITLIPKAGVNPGENIIKSLKV